MKDVTDIAIPMTDFSEVTPFLYYIRVSNGKRQELRDYLKTNGVDTGIHWQPGHHFSLFKNVKSGDLTVTEKISTEILSLPLHSKMENEVVAKICLLINKFFE